MLRVEEERAEGGVGVVVAVEDKEEKKTIDSQASGEDKHNSRAIEAVASTDKVSARLKGGEKTGASELQLFDGNAAQHTRVAKKEEEKKNTLSRSLTHVLVVFSLSFL